VNAFFVKAGESCGGGHAVKAVAMVKKAKFHIGSQKERAILATDVKRRKARCPISFSLSGKISHR